MTPARLVWMVAALVAIQACSPTPVQHVDPIPSVDFGGRPYDIAYASDLQIRSSDLVAIGELSEAFPLADGLGVFALKGVDTRSVIVMRALPGEGVDYLVGYARGFLPEAEPDETEVGAAIRVLTAIPALCNFHAAPPSGAC